MTKFVKIIGIFSLLTATVANAGTIDSAQRMLNQLGYAAGVVDGLYGGKTKRALEAFYADNGGSFDGKLDANEVADLQAAMAERGIKAYVPLSSTDLKLSVLANPDFTLRNQLKLGSKPFDEHGSVFHYVAQWGLGDMNNDGYDDYVLSPMPRGKSGNNSDWRPDIGYCAAPENRAKRKNDPRCTIEFYTPIIAWGSASGNYTLDYSALVSDREEGHSVGNVSIADFNGDGFNDIWQFNAGATHHEGEDILWLSDGTGKTWVDSRDNIKGLRKDFTHGGTAGDIDGDGDIDVVATSNRGTGGRGITCYFNDGSGNFKWKHCAGEDTAVAWAVALGDFDGDGDLDAMLGSDRNYGRTTWAGHEIWLNNGRGKFNRRLAKLDIGHACNTTTAYMDVADIDGDGDVDGIMSVTQFNYAMQSIVIHENLGGGKFQTVEYPLYTMKDMPKSVTDYYGLVDAKRTEDCDVLMDHKNKRISLDNEGNILNHHIQYMYVFDMDKDGNKDIWMTKGAAGATPYDWRVGGWVDRDSMSKVLAKTEGGWIRNLGKGISEMYIKKSETKYRQVLLSN